MFATEGHAQRGGDLAARQRVLEWLFSLGVVQESHQLGAQNL